MSDPSQRAAARVIGLTTLAPKESAVNRAGALRLDPIDGVHIRPTRPVPHEDGHVMEIARTDWDVVDVPIVQVHMTTTFPGRMRAWGMHERSTDRLFVVSGLVNIVCYDGRLDSPTFGCLNRVTLSDRNPGLVVVPPYVYHGWKNIGVEEAVVINMPTVLYNHESPDALDLPYDHPEAADIVPFRW